MADYKRYKTETLLKMKQKAEERDFELTMKPHGNWGDGMRLSKLCSISAWEKNRERLDEINKELNSRRMEEKND